jgi:hypothetical protein
MDLLYQFSEAVARSVAEGIESMAAAVRPKPSRRRKDECERDTCHCDCCICDADLVVYARLGERRIIPVILENSRRLERRIRLELSRWTTRGGKPSHVTAQILTPKEFELPPCEEHQVVIFVDTVGDPSAISTVWTSPAATVVREEDKLERERLPDVDECTVFYADLRVEGCGIRPIRIALALLPRDCYAYEAECDCGCC